MANAPVRNDPNPPQNPPRKRRVFYPASDGKPMAETDKHLHLMAMAGDVHIRCFAEIVRVEPINGRRGVAARIDRYEFLPAAA